MEKKTSNNSNNKNKYLNKNFFQEESEDTIESSTLKSGSFDKNLIENLKGPSKNSIEYFLKKKNFLEESEEEYFIQIQRKYSIEPQLYIKDFVPHPKPLKFHLVPSRLRLNTKGFKDLKCNKDNEFLLKTKNYYISCPNSQENSDFSDCILPDEGLKDLRKKLHNIKTKNNLPKIKSKMICKSNKKQEKEFGLNIEMDVIDDNVNLIDLYSGEENDYVLIENNDNDNENSYEKENDDNNKIKNKKKINSYSILQILQEKTGIEEN
jgi:hypothetical protein